MTPCCMLGTGESATRETKEVPVDAPCITRAVDVVMPAARSGGTGVLSAAEGSGSGRGAAERE